MSDVIRRVMRDAGMAPEGLQVRDFSRIAREVFNANDDEARERLSSVFGTTEPLPDISRNLLAKMQGATVVDGKLVMGRGDELDGVDVEVNGSPLRNEAAMGAYVDAVMSVRNRGTPREAVAEVESGEPSLAGEGEPTLSYFGREIDTSPTLGDKAKDVGIGALRFVGGALEPLLFLQDATFAAIADIGDAVRGESFANNIGQVMKQALSYAPFGNTPDRVVTGSDVLGVFGVEDEGWLRWGGLVMDMVVDPLLVGSAFRLVGKAANAASGATAAGRAAARVAPEAGRAGVSGVAGTAAARVAGGEAAQAVAGVTFREMGSGDKLITIGNAIDEALSIGGAVRKFRGSHPETAGLVNKWIDEKVGSLVAAIQDPTSPWKGLGSERGTGLLRSVLPKTTYRRLMVDDPVEFGERFLRGRKFGDVTAASVGEQVHHVEGMAKAAGQRAAGDAFDAAAVMMRDLVGMAEAGGTQRALSVLNGTHRFTREAVEALPDVLSAAVMKRVYELASQGGIANFNAKTRLSVVDDAVSGVQKTLRGGVDAQGKPLRFGSDVGPSGNYGVTGVTPAERLDGFQALKDESWRELRELAEKQGLRGAAVDDVLERANQLLEHVVVANTRLGYELSGAGAAHERFTSVLMREGVDGVVANNAFADAFTARIMTGADMSTIKFEAVAPGYFGGVGIDQLAAARRSGVFMGDDGHAIVRFENAALGAGESTLGTMKAFDHDELFGAIGLNTYVDAMLGGHLRRVFGWHDDTERGLGIVRGLEEGRFVPSSFLSDNAISTLRGTHPRVADGVSDFIDALTTSAARTDSAGVVSTRFILNKDQVVRHLIEQGTSKHGLSREEAVREALEGWLELNRLTNTDVRETVLSSLLSRYRQRLPGTGSGGDAGLNPASRDFAFRKEIDDEVLEVLMEVMNPVYSIMETGEAAARVLPGGVFMREAYSLGLESGRVVKPSAARDVNGRLIFTDDHGVRFIQIPAEERNVWGAFAGKFVHPMFHREVLNAMSNRSFSPAWLNRMRSLVQGGMLANPGTAVANLAGGIYTSTIGLGSLSVPAMLKHMRDVLPELVRGDSKWFRLMKERVPIGDINPVRNLMGMDSLSEAQRVMAGVSEGGAASGLKGFLDWWSSFIRRPGNQRWAGLDGFEFVDQWVRTAAFKGKYESVLSGGTTRLRSFERGSSDFALHEAGRFAHQSSLDYSDLPRALEFTRDYGLTMFPGFSYLMAGRLLDGVLNTPGRALAYGKLQQLISDSILDPEERMGFYAGTLGTWMAQNRATPIGKWVDDKGSTHVVATPLDMLFPTNYLGAGPLGDSALQFGMWGPLIDIIVSMSTGRSESFTSPQFGRKVMPEGALGGVERGVGMLKYLYGSYAPGFLSKLWQPGNAAWRDDKGLIPGVSRAVRSGLRLDESTMLGMYQIEEVLRGAPNKPLAAELFTAFGRSTNVVSVDGPFSSAAQNYGAAFGKLTSDVTAFKERMALALNRGDAREVERLQGRIQELIDAFVRDHGPTRDVAALMESLRLGRLRGSE